MALACVTPAARQRFEHHGRPWDCVPDRCEFKTEEKSHTHWAAGWSDICST